ncbi:enoyl-CoA hydratase/isomerase family protein [Cochlodiniinecator piscidefendens]|uniref:enoyl-CoA hydratase/isomerase family protein n=1 Tax=Cochlodiniinecator piscidefendens TaxID=2715756 RepID=UPI00140D5336|nr:enoyl-CoA hydratase/isomerase family protein [Cochlodiniinecator piscidefendens]
MIELSKSEGLWVVTINRPDKANSLTLDMLEQLVQIALDAKDQANGFVLTGSGKVFSAGADLDAAKAGLATSDVWERLSGAIAELPCLTIAALNGTLAGGAFGMALACDLRIAVPHAKFFYPVMKLGFLPQPSDPVRLRSLIGPSKTKLILMASQKIDAAQAYQFGLVDMIVEIEELIPTVRSLAEPSLAARPEIRAGIKALCT